MKYYINRIFPFLILLNGIISVNQWSKIKLTNQTISWIVNFLIIIIIVIFRINFFSPTNRRDYRIFKFYFAWMILGLLRAIFVAENYWEWKQLIEGTFALSIPVFVYVCIFPNIVQIILKYWIKFGLPIFIILVWNISPDAYQFYLAPVIFLGGFWPILDKKWQILIVGLLLLMIFIDIGARSQIIKSLSALLLGFAYVYTKLFSDKVLRVVHLILIITPIVFLILAFSGSLNIFEGFAVSSERYLQNNTRIRGDKADEFSGDTRTFIYREVISSAIKHDYVLFGRTPAKGNDSNYFGAEFAEKLGTGKYERHSNEVCFPNIFTWLGLVGLILYSIIYIKSSYLALYKSNNLYMKLIGVYIAFRFLFGWVEDFNRFDIMNVVLWMTISMGFSQKFRQMNDVQFKLWVKSIF